MLLQFLHKNKNSWNFFVNTTQCGLVQRRPHRCHVFGHCSIYYRIEFPLDTWFFIFIGLKPIELNPNLKSINHNSLKLYFVSKIVLTYCEKKIVLVIKKNVWDSRLRIWKKFQITRTVCLNSERSEQFL